MFIVLLLIGLVTAIPLYAAVAEPTTIEEVFKLLPTFIDLAKDGKWLMFGAVLTLVIVFAIKKYFYPKLSNDKLPWVSLGVGILTALAIDITTGASIKEAALALMSGPTASALWSLIAKHFFTNEKK